MRLSVYLITFVTMLLGATSVYGENSKAQELPSKATIAIRDVDASRTISDLQKKKELLAKLEEALLATKRFDVLSRDKKELSSLRDEQQFSASSFSKGQAAKSGELLAANYIIIPKISEFSFRRAARAMPNIDRKYFVSDSGNISVDMKVLDAETGSIKAVFSVKDSFKTREQISNSRGGAPSRARFTRMAENLAKQFANQLLETVFPTRVLKVEGKDIWLNRGKGSGIKEGIVMTVFRPGEALVDPYTKENLGASEVEVGKVKITRINPKVSVAQLVEAKKSDSIQVGDIVRQ